MKSFAQYLRTLLRGWSRDSRGEAISLTWLDFGAAAVGVVVGAVIFLLGGVPMVRAFAVSGKLLDDGVDPGDRAIMNNWNAWAFTFENFALLICGCLLVAASVALHVRFMRFRRTRQVSNV